MIFVDTSALIALLVEDDLDHQAVNNIFSGLNGSDLLVSYEVVCETLNLLSKKQNAHAVYLAGSALFGGKACQLVDSSPEDQLLALEIIKKYHDQDLSYTDANSFALINRLKIKKVFSLDSDFNLLKGVENLFNNKNCS